MCCLKTSRTTEPSIWVRSFWLWAGCAAEWLVVSAGVDDDVAAELAGVGVGAGDLLVGEQQGDAGGGVLAAWGGVGVALGALRVPRQGAGDRAIRLLPRVLDGGSRDRALPPVGGQWL